MKLDFGNTIFALCISFLCTIFTIFLLSFIGFIFHISINIFYPLIGILVGQFILYFYLHLKKISITNILFAFLMYFLILALFLTISGFIFDYSYDGRVYHQGGIIFLEKGWNPIFDDINTFAHSIFGTNNYSLLWIENYPKFCEIVQANIFHILKKIEFAKVLNLLSGFIVFGYSFFVLSKDNFKKSINSFTKILISFLIAANPVFLAQVFTFYIDSYIYMFFMLIILAIIDLETQKENTPWAFGIILMSSVCLINVKLGGIFYTTVTFTAYIFYLILRKQKHKIKNLCLCMIAIFILGILSGINPYFTNIKQHRHPLYPLAGENKIDIITNQQPKSFKDQFYIINIFKSYFSKVNNIQKTTTRLPEVKIPFSIHRSEMKYISDCDTRICGFGVLWSGIIILTLVLSFGIRYNSKKEKQLGLLIFSVLVLLFIFNPYSWWARYAPHLWVIPIFVCLLTLKSVHNHIATKIMAYIILFLMLSNISIQFVKIVETEKRSMKSENAYIKRIKQFPEPIKIYSVYDYSFIEKLLENNIEFELVDEDEYKQNCEKYSLIHEITGEGMYWNHKE